MAIVSLKMKIYIDLTNQLQVLKSAVYFLQIRLHLQISQNKGYAKMIVFTVSQPRMSPITLKSTSSLSMDVSMLAKIEVPRPTSNDSSIYDFASL